MDCNPREINIANIRKALAGEEKTIAEYIEFSAMAGDNDPVVASVFAEIANEEKVHVGELHALLDRLENNMPYEMKGYEEVEDTEANVLASLEDILQEVPMENYENKKDYYKAIAEKLLSL